MPRNSTQAVTSWFGFFDDGEPVLSLSFPFWDNGLKEDKRRDYSCSKRRSSRTSIILGLRMAE